MAPTCCWFWSFRGICWLNKMKDKITSSFSLKNNMSISVGSILSFSYGRSGFHTLGSEPPFGYIVPAQPFVELTALQNNQMTTYCVILQFPLYKHCKGSLTFSVWKSVWAGVWWYVYTFTELFFNLLYFKMLHQN